MLEHSQVERLLVVLSGIGETLKGIEQQMAYYNRRCDENQAKAEKAAEELGKAVKDAFRGEDDDPADFWKE